MLLRLEVLWHLGVRLSVESGVVARIAQEVRKEFRAPKLFPDFYHLLGDPQGAEDPQKGRTKDDLLFPERSKVDQRLSVFDLALSQETGSKGDSEGFGIMSRGCFFKQDEDPMIEKTMKLSLLKQLKPTGDSSKPEKKETYVDKNTGETQHRHDMDKPQDGLRTSVFVQLRPKLPNHDLLILNSLPSLNPRDLRVLALKYGIKPRNKA